MRQAGEITIADPGSDKPLLVVATMMCCHCGRHIPYRPGSGVVRGWCQRCNGMTCGPQCEACRPTEQLLENLEKGRPADYRPIIVPTSI